MFWIVRADTFWYKFDDKQKAQEHYNYIFNNKDGKYKNIDKIYLVEYCKDKTPKILERWNREKSLEVCSYER